MNSFLNTFRNDWCDMKILDEGIDDDAVLMNRFETE